MARLAEYLCELAELYGALEHVHFDKVVNGSAELVARVEVDYHSRVVTNVREAGQKVGSKRAIQAAHRLSEMMSDDLVEGSILDGAALILQFPKAQRVDPLIVIEDGSVQGYLYNIGGKDASVPVRLEGANDEALVCEATPELAQDLARHLFSYIRVHGKGEWVQKPEGGWRLKKLWIRNFEPLKQGSLSEAIGHLRSLGPTHWDEADDPHKDILGMRG